MCDELLLLMAEQLVLVYGTDDWLVDVMLMANLSFFSSSAHILITSTFSAMVIIRVFLGLRFEMLGAA